MSDIAQIKIYGERNTGTHFLNDLLAKNFTVPLLPSSPETMQPRKKKVIAARERYLSHVRKNGHQIYRHVVADRYNDIANQRYLPKTFGWKHTLPPLDFLETRPMARQTLFIITVKHPVYWALSYHRRPYHSYFPVQQMEFSEFIRHLFIPTGRDNVNVPLYESIIDLYAAKVDGYRRLVEAAFPAELIRYEELIADISGFLKRVEEKYALERNSEEEHVREKNMKKGDDATLTDFRTKYQLDRVTEAVSPEDYQFLMSRFGAERLAWLGYPPA
jgi:hypothetical protein